MPVDPLLSPPQTAAQLLELVRHSQWFAESLFSQIASQSRDYLAYPAAEFGQALVEKRCLSAWQVSELLAGRFSFYCNELRLLEQIGSKPTVFVAEQGRTSRLILVEIQGHREVQFEFVAGCRLTELLTNCQFDQPLLESWREQVQQATEMASGPVVEMLNPSRTSVDANGKLQFWRPLTGPMEAVESASERKTQALSRFDPWFQKAERLLKSDSRVPQVEAAVPLNRQCYQPLIRKGPAWSSVARRPDDLNWEPSESFSSVADEIITAGRGAEDPSFDEIELNLAQPVASPRTATRNRKRSRLSRRLWISMILLTTIAVAASWGWIRSQVQRIQAGESPIRKTPQPASSQTAN